MKKVIFESTVKYGSTIHYNIMTLPNVTKIDCTEMEIPDGQKYYMYTFSNKNDDIIALSNEDNILTLKKEEDFPGDTYKLC